MSKREIFIEEKHLLFEDGMGSVWIKKGKYQDGTEIYSIGIVKATSVSGVLMSCHHTVDRELWDRLVPVEEP